VPINSPALNPLDDFQLQERHLTAGAVFGLRSRWADLRAEYRREVDPSVDFFISERTALTAVLRPAERLTLTGGAEYDLAQGWWGTSDLFLRYVDAASMPTPVCGDTGPISSSGRSGGRSALCPTRRSRVR
jgi:hypothetical protein